MASECNEAETSEQRPTFRGFYLNPHPVGQTVRPRSPSFSIASSHDPTGPRCWDEDIVHVLEDLEGANLFKKYLEERQLKHFYDFYFICNGFKNMVKESAPMAKLLKIVKLTYERYIKKGHAQCLESLNEDVRSAIGGKTGADTIDITIFDAAQQQALDFLRQTTFKSFLESDTYLKSDIYLDFVDYKQHQNLAEMRRRKRKAAPIQNKEEYLKNWEVAQHHDHLARNEHARFFSEVERALTEGNSLEVIASSVPSEAISGGQHQPSHNHDQDEKLQNTVTRQSSPPEERKAQEPTKNPTKSSVTKENIEKTAHNHHQHSQTYDKRSVQSIRSDNRRRIHLLKERDGSVAERKVWDFGPKISTEIISNNQKYKQHPSDKSHDQECSDQSILDEHCSQVFGNSPSPPRNWIKEKAKDPASLGLDGNKAQTTYRMSWQGEFNIDI